MDVPFALWMSHLPIKWYMNTFANAFPAFLSVRDALFNAQYG